ncbi:MAG TPA: gliding motility-associated C-terminal domain-containing protein [Bacteroidia bacterium]|jgi:gliding motility-associated-like protein|nr:gliding motility-associated C-terminal domain-containing protein [Bacteroidia bacterium]
MKVKKLLLASALFFGLYTASAQITITSADMPNPNDNILISVNTSLANFQPNLTGANYTWDYSKLIPDSQRYVSFVPPASSPYPLFIFLGGGASYGTRNYTPDALPWSLIGGGTPPTNAYDFYKNSGASYNFIGEGLTEGTTMIPAYNSVPDRVYAFPMNYLNKDSSNSVLSIPIPNQFYYGKRQKRVNQVDGWGTLITPYGTFNALRVKSTLTIVDTIYIDTVHLGFKIPRPITYEYKWFGVGSKIPLLEIDATATGGNNITVTRANWQDSLLKPIAVSFIQQSTCPIVKEGSLTAHVTGGRYPLTYLWSTGQTTSSITNLAPGSYSVTITDRYGRVVHAVDSVKPINDSSCLILLSFTTTPTCPMTKNGALSASETGGRNPVKYLWSTGDTTVNINNLAPGNYDLTVTDKYGRQVTATGTVEGYTQNLNCLNIPSAFTPDGDGVNDVWNIRSLSEYASCKIEIFNQWGSLVFKSTGYSTSWDGKYNGEPVPAGAYYYIIDLNNNSNKYTGTVTIVK